MFGLNYILRYIMSRIYHLYVSEIKTFLFSALIPSSYVIFDQLRYMEYWV